MENQIPKHLLTDDVKHMSTRSLELLAVQIREKLLDDVSSCGGHLASNLGVVELTLALHRVFDVYKDRIVWDVGHQTYVHKLLTGRWDDMTTLRQLDGLSGFPKRMESRSDAFDSGHSGSSVSAAFGYAKARDLKGEDYACVAVIGDGALNCGVSFEALNSAGAEKTPLIVVLNDNEMSISKNVGGVAKHLQELRTSAPYLGIKKSIKTATANMPRLQRGLTSARDTLKYAIVPGVIFEQMGFKYYGPVDGHDIDAMTTVLQSAKEQQRPVFIHVITKKGKGFIPAEKNPSKFLGGFALDGYLFRAVWRGAGGRSGGRRPHRCDHRSHDGRYRPFRHEREVPEPRIRRRHRGAARGVLCRGSGAGRAQTRRSHLFHVPAAGVRSGDHGSLPAEPACGVRAGQKRRNRARR